MVVQTPTAVQIFSKKFRFGLASQLQLPDRLRSQRKMGPTQIVCVGERNGFK